MTARKETKTEESRDANDFPNIPDEWKGKKIVAHYSKEGKLSLSLTGQETVSVPSAFELPEEIETKAKISRHVLKAQTVNIETIKNMQEDLFCGEYELVAGQSKEQLQDQFDEFVKDFRGMTLDYWEKKVVIACYCLIDRQQANPGTPHIILETKADLYKEVLDKDKNGRYSGNERKLFEEAKERLKHRPQQLIFYKTVRDGKKTKREYVLVEAPFITGIITQHTTEDDTEQSVQDIKEKGRDVIQFHNVVFDGLVDSYRLIPRNVSREIRAICTNIRKTTQLMEDFIYWLHSHDSRNTAIRRTKPVLIRELKQDDLYKKNKKRVIKNLHECYEIAKRTGYLTDYKIDQKGKGAIVDVFYLNPEKIDHVRRKPKEETVEALPGGEDG